MKAKKVVDWYYHRKSWITCGKSQEFLDDLAEIQQTIDAKKVRFDAQSVPDLLKKVDYVISIRNKKINEFDLKAIKQKKMKEEEVVKELLGPSGNLRAPALILNKTLIVGFEPEKYKSLLE